MNSVVSEALVARCTLNADGMVCSYAQLVFTRHGVQRTTLRLFELVGTVKEFMFALLAWLGMECSISLLHHFTKMLMPWLMQAA